MGRQNQRSRTKPCHSQQISPRSKQSNDCCVSEPNEQVTDIPDPHLILIDNNFHTVTRKTYRKVETESSSELLSGSNDVC